MAERILPRRRQQPAPAPTTAVAQPEPVIHVMPERQGLPPAGITWADVSRRRKSMPPGVPYWCAACGSMVLDFDWPSYTARCLSGCVVERTQRPVAIAPNNPNDRAWWSPLNLGRRRIVQADDVKRCPFCEQAGVEINEDGEFFCRKTRRADGEWRVIGCGMIWQERQQGA